MRSMIKLVFFLLLYMGMAGAPLHAWQLELREHPGQAPALWLGNANPQQGVEVYLLWADFDAAPGPRIMAWQPGRGWGEILRPVSDETLDVPPLPATALPGVGLPAACPAGHRCFLGLVSLPPGRAPLDAAAWRAASLLPLTLEAARERLPGQNRFVTPDSALFQHQNGSRELDAPVNADGEVTPTAPTGDEDTGQAKTEKPDIFRLEGSQLLYANGQAQRFQVLEVADPALPRLQAQVPLEGRPVELYTLNGYYLILQTGDQFGADGEAEGTRITVFRPEPQGELTRVSEFVIEGRFLESRRRDDTLYTVAQTWEREGSQVHVNALRLDGNGELVRVETRQLPGYSPIVAIFSDYLLVANHDPENWGQSLLQVYELGQADSPLRPLPPLSLPGRLPSEFHLDIRDQQLRLVHGPEDRQAGSVLAIYRLPDLEPMGRLDGIAPGESLFATRFVGDRAFVVTYLQQDPLWVIDLSDPAQPRVLGELKVPGWSEKLFFNQDRLFAVGIDDLPAPGEEFEWARRVAASLFDVSDPTDPRQLDRFTPLVGEVAYSHSPALEDERALLLDWSERFAALPVEAWHGAVGSHLQLLDFSADRFHDLGRLSFNTPVLRSLRLDESLLGVLGDQSFFTVDRGQQPPRILAELELAGNQTWLKRQGDNLWVGARGREGYYRLYRHPLPFDEPAAERWSLPRGYQELLLSENLALFLSTHPLRVQALDLAGGELWPPRELESGSGEWRYRSQPLLQGDKLYLAENQGMPQPLRGPDGRAVNDAPGLWLLKTWQLRADGARQIAAHTLPGEPEALTPDGRLITRELTARGGIRFNLVSLDNRQARLINSLTLPDCHFLTSTLMRDDHLYVTCGEPRYYIMAAAEDNAGNAASPSPRLFQLKAGNFLGLEQTWELSEPRQVLAAAGDKLALGGWGHSYPGIVEPARPGVDLAVMPAPGSAHCQIYRLDERELQPLLELEDCPFADGLALDDDQAYLARGFAGVERRTLPENGRRKTAM